MTRRKLGPADGRSMRRRAAAFPRIDRHPPPAIVVELAGRAKASAQLMARLGWVRVDVQRRGKLSARWEHTRGWLLEHCGHATALWPWALYDARGRMHLGGGLHSDTGDPTHGRAWANLLQPMIYVEAFGPEGYRAMDEIERREPAAVRWHPDTWERARRLRGLRG